MPAEDPNKILLRRIWASIWDAARYAGSPPLDKPAFSYDSCAWHLELAAQALVRIRTALEGDQFESIHHLPLEGRSKKLLESALDGDVDGLPRPGKDPAGFVCALVHAGLQTGDGAYGLGLEKASKVDELLKEHCSDLMESASALQRPDVATKEAEGAARELSEALSELLTANTANTPLDGENGVEVASNGHTVLSSEQTVVRNGQLLSLSHQMRRMSERMREMASTPLDESKSEPLSPKASEPTSAQETPSPDADASGSPLGDSGESIDRSGDVDMCEDEKTQPVDEPLDRTKSQCIKRIKVEEVAAEVEKDREPVQQLRRSLSLLDKKITAHEVSSAAGMAEEPNEAKYQRLAAELEQVQKLRKSFINFGEDLMQGMMTLDELSGLAEPDRQARKETLAGIQYLLDEIDAGKARVANVERKLAAELEECRPKEPRKEKEVVEMVEESPSAAEERMATPPQPSQDVPPSTSKPSAAGKGKTSRKRSALQMPKVDWSRVKLPVKFSSVERPRAYVLSATLPGLDADTVKLTRKEGSLLSIRGVKVPTAAEQRALEQILADHIERFPPAERHRLDLEDLMVQLGHGRYGHFLQEFEVPRDVDWANIVPSYEDGVLKVVLPRLADEAGFRAPQRSFNTFPYYGPQSARTPGVFGSRGGYPGGGLFGGRADDFFW